MIKGECWLVDELEGEFKVSMHHRRKIPNNKSQITNKFQIPNDKFQIVPRHQEENWNLEFYLGFVIWDLPTVH